jgi:hypothetical protein
MELNADHVIYLKFQVKGWKPEIPYYVYQLSGESVDPILMGWQDYENK